MVHAEIVKRETLETDDGKPYVVFTLALRLGMKRWQIRRKYDAFRQLESLLRANYAEASNTGLGTTPLPKDAGSPEREFELVQEFLAHLSASTLLLDMSPTRQFLQVPSSRSVLDLSNDSTRSMLSAPLSSLVTRSFNLTLPSWVPARTDVADLVLVVTNLLTAAPVFAGAPAALQPAAAALAVVVGVWYLFQKDGVVDEVLAAAWGRENVSIARDFVRPPDMPFAWMSVGVAFGLALGADTPFVYATAVASARLAVILSFLNLAFMDMPRYKPKQAVVAHQ